MRTLSRLFARLLDFTTRHGGDERLREAMESHIEAEAEGNLRAGMTSEEAHRRARLTCELKETIREQYNGQESLPFMENLLRDTRFAFRTLRRSSAFTIVAVLTLIVGIGGVTAVFSVVDAVLLRPLPYPHAERLVVLHMGLQHFFSEGNLSPADILAYQRENKAFTGVAGFLGAGYEVTGVGGPFRAEAERVSASMFSVLDVPPHFGRAFTQQEDDDSTPVVVISYALWKVRFGSSPSVLGKVIDLDRRPYTVIGVMPESFETPSGAGGVARHDLWVPLSLTPEERGEVADNFDYGAVARLRPSVTMPQAQEDVQRVLALIQAEVPVAKLSIALRGLKDQTVDDARPLLCTLMGAVMLILIIACANLANLLMVRAAGRRREFGMRLALGAKRRAMLRQLLTESLLLSVLGGTVGLVLIILVLDAATALLPRIAPDLPRVEEISVRWPVAGLAILLICSTGVLCGLMPALVSMKAEVLDALRDGGLTVGYGRHQHRVRGLVVVAEAGLAMLLLVGSGLLLRSFVRMLNVNPGFQPENVMTASLALPKEDYHTQEKVDEFLADLERKIDVIPGVQAVGFSTDIPVIGQNSSRPVAAQGYVPKPNESIALAANYLVMGDYFGALRIPLIEGRYFTAADDQPNAPLVTIISQSFAKRYFPGREAVGRGIKVGLNYNTPAPTIRVVGVVGDVSDNPLDQKQDVETYEPVSQAAGDFGPYGNMIGVVGSLRAVARTASDPKALGALFTRTVQNTDSLLAVTEIKTMDEMVASTETSRRFSTGALTAFAAVALLLALLGMYGVLAYLVAERRREIAIRIALGATRADVLRRVLRQALVLGLSGIAVGLIASAGLTRYLTSLLYGVQALDSLAIIGAVVILLSCTLFAGWLPARRAASVDPMRVLRSE